MKYITTLIVILFLVPLTVRAAAVSIVVPDHVVGLHEQFAVDVILDTEGQAINGLEGSIEYSAQSLQFVRAEEGKSIIPLWIQHPTNTLGTISYSGIIPNGYAGTIDPFDRERIAPGTIIRLVFEAIAPGNATVSAETTLTKNDGEGSIEELPSMATSFAISQTPSTLVYSIADTTPPTITAERVRDVDLYDNAYTLIFDAQDKESGIAYVEVKEKKQPWKKISSPYRLEDQQDDATLQVRVVDQAGNTTIVTIGTLEPSFTQLIFLALVLIIGFPLMVLCYKRYVYKKK